MSREIRYRYDLLSHNNSKIGELECLNGTINMKADAAVKYSARFQIKENEAKDVNYLKDRIRPVLIVDGVEHSLGNFIISSPGRERIKSSTFRSVTAYDISQILQEDCFTETYFIKKRSRYKDVITRIINSAGIMDTNIISSTEIFKRDREIEIGKTKLEILNELLKEINYTNIFVNNFGVISAKPYILPNIREVQHNYIFGENATIVNSRVVDEIDLYKIPNVFIAVVSNPEKKPLVAKFVNNKLGNPLSTTNRGRQIVKIEKLKDITDKLIADGYVRRLAYESTNVFRSITFSTLNTAQHGFADCLYIKHDDLAINGKYIESEWQMQLKVGATMTHKAQKVEILT